MSMDIIEIVFSFGLVFFVTGRFLQVFNWFQLQSTPVSPSPNFIPDSVH
jgi:hypothetical protein